MTFEKGFNVISGLSDTGKSYVFACINYMLGGSNPPKAIPEAIGYSNILLEIKTYTGQTFTLSRNMQGGTFKLKEVEIDMFQTQGTARELKSQHVNGSKDNISSFLLQLSGYDEKYVRINKNNAKREISYRDIARLTLIDEERIITEKSPVYSSGQFNQQIQEQSILEILLTGKDAKELEQVEEAKIYHSRIKGKLEFVDSLIKDLSEKILILEKEKTNEKQKQLQAKIEKLSLVLQESSVQLETLTKEKKQLYNSISELDSKNILHEELRSRFVLLQEHYNSDIKRLAFITEGEDYFSQLTTIKCPLCGGDMDKGHYDCIIEEDKKSSSVIDSIQKEIDKIKIKLSDLESTLAQLNSDKSKRDNELISLKRQYQIVQSEIQNNIEPIKSSTKEEIDALLIELSLIKEQELYKTQLANYYGQRNQLEIELARKPKVGEQSDGIKYTILQGLCDTIKVILTNWKYPNVATVNFNTDYSIFDFVINQKNRNAHGKGIRAITYSAFVIGLMDYCVSNNLAHPRNIIIDSPLTTYHGKEQGELEEISRDMQDAFFKDLADTLDDRQIIILDNKEPREELKSKINYIHFTNEKTRGRQGFFPL
ncbi:MAG: hypothetical protein HYU71_06315 [Bacteroidetes bacterium]|nr:hypothetical protein [Bacteroidota bacterium]